MQIENILEALASGGWSDLENIQSNFSKMAREQGAAERQETERHAAIFAATFGTDDGKKALDILVRMTLLQPPREDEMAAASAEQYALLKAHRAGQNSIVFMLLARLQQHHKTHNDEKQPGGVS